MSEYYVAPVSKWLARVSAVISPLAPVVKVGLAHALAKIISNRSKQTNFQLVTITHDEVKICIDNLALTKRCRAVVEAF